MPGGFSQIACGQPVLRQISLRCSDNASDHLHRYAELFGHLLNRMGPLTAQPEI
jgi:hypothetical protein